MFSSRDNLPKEKELTNSINQFIELTNANKTQAALVELISVFRQYNGSFPPDRLDEFLKALCDSQFMYQHELRNLFALANFDILPFWQMIFSMNDPVTINFLLQSLCDNSLANLIRQQANIDDASIFHRLSSHVNLFDIDPITMGAIQRDVRIRAKNDLNKLRISKTIDDILNSQYPYYLLFVPSSVPKTYARQYLNRIQLEKPQEYKKWLELAKVIDEPSVKVYIEGLFKYNIRLVVKFLQEKLIHNLTQDQLAVISSKSSSYYYRILLTIALLELGEIETASINTYNLLEIKAFELVDFFHLIIDPRLKLPKYAKLSFFTADNLLSSTGYLLLEAAEKLDVLLCSLSPSTFLGAYIETNKGVLGNNSIYNAFFKALTEFCEKNLGIITYVRKLKTSSLIALRDSSVKNAALSKETKEFVRLALEELASREVLAASSDLSVIQKIIISLQHQNLQGYKQCYDWFITDKLQNKPKNHDLEYLIEILKLGDVGLQFALHLYEREAVILIDLALAAQMSQEALATSPYSAPLFAIAALNSNDFKTVAKVVLDIAHSNQGIHRTLQQPMFDILISDKLDARGLKLKDTQIFQKFPNKADRLNLLLICLCPQTFLGKLVATYKPTAVIGTTMIDHLLGQLRFLLHELQNSATESAALLFPQTKSALFKDQGALRSYLDYITDDKTKKLITHLLSEAPTKVVPAAPLNDGIRNNDL